MGFVLRLVSSDGCFANVFLLSFSLSYKLNERMNGIFFTLELFMHENSFASMETKPPLIRTEAFCGKGKTD